MINNSIKNQDINEFLFADSAPIHAVQTVTTFGKNSATYKFALLHALLKRKDRKLEWLNVIMASCSPTTLC